MKILVTGGTGTVGSQVVRELLGYHAEVHVLTRHADKARHLPQGVRAITGDLLAPETVRTVFKGMDAVFLLNAVSPTEAHEGLLALNGMRLAGVRRVVYLSVHNADQAPHLPHFGTKLAIEIAIKGAGIPYTILRPNNFFQNDYWYKEALLQHGVYPQPIGHQGVSRVDVRDVAEAAAIALVKGGHEGQTYNLVGPHAHTGRTAAEAWGRALGKPITYAGDDLDAWEAQAQTLLPAWMAFDFRLMYAYFQQHGLRATAGDILRQDQLLGHVPRSLDDFAAETAKIWKT
jgi:uncharacterized protein YbjT (DUF2867 family)